jgi:hypothetical protein
MPPQYTVRAQVIDVRTDSPRPTDVFLVDTNVWYWRAYSSAGAMPGSATPGSATPTQMGPYSAYLQECIATGAIVYRTGLCLAELAHLIEQNERDIYSGAVAPVAAKEYRHNLPSERARVVAEVQKAWATVKGQSQPLSLTIDDSTTDAALARFATQPIDGFDLFLLEGMTAAGLTQILTDDGDFCTVGSLQVFTTNPRVLAAARAAHLLLVR